MKVIVLLLIFGIGLFAGYNYFSEEHSATGMAIKCSFKNEPCTCDIDVCECGNHTIMSKECYSNSNG